MTGALLIGCLAVATGCSDADSADSEAATTTEDELGEGESGAETSGDTGGDTAGETTGETVDDSAETTTDSAGEAETSDSSEDTSDDSSDSAGDCVEQALLDTTLVTDDAVALIADTYMLGQVGAPAVVLLHMIPPNNSKANFPGSFVELLTARGFNVVNVNRRGAPGSEGVATEAYIGPNGKWDVKAAYDYLTDHPCQVPAGQIVVIGASNGTTSALDFSLYAAGEDSVEQPRGLVFLSAGGYTGGNQGGLQTNMAALGHPILFNYPSAETAYNEAVSGWAPAAWNFQEYAPGAHGTGMFGSNPESASATADWVEALFE